MWGIKAEVRLPRPRYANTLETLAAQGPRAFYEGEIAVQLGREMQAAGGALRASDLAAYKAEVRAPVCGSYRQYKICGMGPPSSGETTVFAVLKQLEPQLPPSVSIVPTSQSGRPPRHFSPSSSQLTPPREL